MILKAQKLLSYVDVSLRPAYKRMPAGVCVRVCVCVCVCVCAHFELII